MTEGHNRLAVLAEEIKEAHAVVEASARYTAEQALAAGDRLLEAKALVPRGQWLPWLEQNCGLSERVAQNYMRVARVGVTAATLAEAGLTATLKHVAKGQLIIPGPGEAVFGVSGRASPDFGREHGVWLWDSPQHPGFLDHILVHEPPNRTLSAYHEAGRLPVNAKHIAAYLDRAGWPVSQGRFSLVPDVDLNLLEEWRQEILRQQTSPNDRPGGGSDESLRA